MATSMGKGFEAAVLHDYLLTTISRKEAAYIFRDALKYYGVTMLVRQPMFWAVRFNDKRVK